MIEQPYLQGQPASAALTQRANALLEAKRPADAIGVLHQAIAMDPGTVQARCLLALAHLRLDQPAEALAAAGDASAYAPEYEWPHRLRASALIQLSRPKEALAAARVAVNLSPERPEVFLMLAEAELAARSFGAARSSTLRALELDPFRPGAHVMLSTLALRAGAWRQAEGHARDALGLDPENTAAMNNLGLALRATGRRREAVHYLGTASRLDPRNPLYRRNAMRATTRFSIGVVLALVLGVEVMTAGWGPGIMGTGVLALALFAGTAIRTGRAEGWLRAPAAIWHRRGPRGSDPKASPEMMQALRRERLHGLVNREVLHDRSLLAAALIGLALLAYLGTAGRGTVHNWASAFFIAVLGGWSARLLYLRWRRWRSGRGNHAG